MGRILMNVPDISDQDLIYDEAETKQILKFFWPLEAKGIDELNINNEYRRLAQTALIAAIDGSYALSFPQAIIESFIGSKRNIKKLTEKLTKKFVKNWWKHTTQKNLEDVEIYESIRVIIARNLNLYFFDLKNGLTLKGMKPFYARVAKPRVGRG